MDPSGLQCPYCDGWKTPDSFVQHLRDCRSRVVAAAFPHLHRSSQKRETSPLHPQQQQSIEFPVEQALRDEMDTLQGSLTTHPVPNTYEEASSKLVLLRRKLMQRHSVAAIPSDMVPCLHCGRTFFRDRVERHQVVCARVFGDVSRPDSRPHAITTTNPSVLPTTGRGGGWRESRETMLRKIRSAKAVTWKDRDEEDAERIDRPTTPPPPALRRVSSSPSRPLSTVLLPHTRAQTAPATETSKGVRIPPKTPPRGSGRPATAEEKHRRRMETAAKARPEKGYTARFLTITRNLEGLDHQHQHQHQHPPHAGPSRTPPASEDPPPRDKYCSACGHPFFTSQALFCGECGGRRW